MTLSVRAQVRQYVQEHPGYHRGRDVGQALGISTHDALVALRTQWEAGHINRSRPRGATYYRYYSTLEGS